MVVVDTFLYIVPIVTALDVLCDKAYVLVDKLKKELKFIASYNPIVYYLNFGDKNGN